MYADGLLTASALQYRIQSPDCAKYATVQKAMINRDTIYVILDYCIYALRPYAQPLYNSRSPIFVLQC